MNMNFWLHVCVPHALTHQKRGRRVRSPPAGVTDHMDVGKWTWILFKNHQDSLTHRPPLNPLSRDLKLELSIYLKMPEGSIIWEEPQVCSCLTCWSEHRNRMKTCGVRTGSGGGTGMNGHHRDTARPQQNPAEWTTEDLLRVINL